MRVAGFDMDAHGNDVVADHRGRAVAYIIAMGRVAAFDAVDVALAAYHVPESTGAVVYLVAQGAAYSLLELFARSRLAGNGGAVQFVEANGVSRKCFRCGADHGMLPLQSVYRLRSGLPGFWIPWAGRFCFYCK